MKKLGKKFIITVSVALLFIFSSAALIAPASAYYDPSDSEYLYDLGSGHWGMLQATYRQSPIIDANFGTLSGDLQDLLNMTTNENFGFYSFNIDFSTTWLHLTMYPSDYSLGSDWYYDIGDEYLDTDIDVDIWAMIQTVGHQQYTISIYEPTETVLSYYFPPFYWEQYASIRLETTILRNLGDVLASGIDWVDPRFFVGCSFVVTDSQGLFENRIYFNFSTSAWRTYKTGYEYGVERGTEEIYEYGQQQYDAGLDAGYNQGYAAGYADADSGVVVGVSWLFSFMEGFSSMLELELFPGLKLWHLVALPILFAALFLILKLVK